MPLLLAELLVVTAHGHMPQTHKDSAANPLSIVKKAGNQSIWRLLTTDQIVTFKGSQENPLLMPATQSADFSQVAIHADGVINFL